MKKKKEAETSTYTSLLIHLEAVNVIGWEINGHGDLRPSESVTMKYDRAAMIYHELYWSNNQLRQTAEAVESRLSTHGITTLAQTGAQMVPLEMTPAQLWDSLPQVLAVMGLQFGYLLGGSILVETVFNWPGSGGLMNLAIFRRDIPVLSATILVLAAIFVVINILVDVLQALIDPRMRR
jgi:hypothetical protein